jgi:hypothetical protein
MTLGILFDALSTIEARMGRLENKIDSLCTQFSIESSSAPLDSALDECSTMAGTSCHRDRTNSISTMVPPQTECATRAGTDSCIIPSLSFSAHQTVFWEGIRSLIPTDLSTPQQDFEQEYHSRLELARPPLDLTTPVSATTRDTDWLSSLSLASVQELTNSYFNTFNRIYPLLDRDDYFQNILTPVIRKGFGCDIESSIMLNTMALGCMGLKASDEGAFDGTVRLTLNPPILEQIMEGPICGLTFFTEALKRFSTCVCLQDIQSCQYYMTAALFFIQIVRPADAWLMISRASPTFCTTLKFPHLSDEWSTDMLSRLYWSALLMESVIVQELELPLSRLKEWQDVVPLPKFITYPRASQSRPRDETDDTFYHYHFLAQTAHRIILSRIREELYCSNPSTTVAIELRHQLEEWDKNQPDLIKGSAVDASMKLDKCPAYIVAGSLLKMRYHVGIFHIGRPFLYKAIHHPILITDSDLKICADALSFAMNWPLAMEPCSKMHSFMPLRFFTASHMFGQLLIFYAIQRSPDARIRDLLPAGHELWCAQMLRYMSGVVDLSPVIAKDFELVSAMYSQRVTEPPQRCAQDWYTCQLADK